MSDHGKFSRKKEKAISALIACGTVEEAARAAGIAPATLNRWRKLPGFEEEFAQAKRELLAGTINQVQNTARQAVACLQEVMVSGKSETARVASARVLLELAFRLFEVEEVAAKLNRLEAQMEAKK